MMHPSSSSFPSPLLLLLSLSSSSTSSAPSCAHSVKRQRLRRFSDAPPLTSIPLPEAARAHALPTTPTSDHRAANVASAFGFFFFFFKSMSLKPVFPHRSSVAGQGRPPSPPHSLTWEFTSEVIFLSALPAEGSGLVRAALRRHPVGRIFFFFGVLSDYMKLKLELQPQFQPVVAAALRPWSILSDAPFQSVCSVLPS